MEYPGTVGALLRPSLGRVGVKATLALIGASFCQAPLQGQEPKPLVEVGEVREVRVVGETVLGGLDDPFDLSSPFVRVHRRIDGGYVVHSLHYELSSLALFDGEGRFAGHLGREGDGPGEHRRIVAFAAHALDSVMTVDASGRFNVFDPHGEVTRTGRLSPVPWFVIWLEDGRLIVASDSRRPQFAGIPLHLMSADGAHIGSLGTLDGVRDPRSASSERRRIPVASGKGRDLRVYSVWPTTYRIDAWSPDGQLQEAWVQKNEWFPRETSSDGGTALITGVFQDSDQRLWVATGVGDPNQYPERETKVAIGQLNNMMDTVVEVIDLSTGSTLAHGRLKGRAAGFSSAGELVTLAEEESGLVRIHLLKLGVFEVLATHKGLSPGACIYPS